MKFKNCLNKQFLPPFFTDPEFEPLESVSNAKKAWSE
jgi:hypothetical protein